MKSKKKQRQRLERMKRLYEVEKKSLREITNELKISHQVVHDRLTRAGVKMRPIGLKKRKRFDREILIELYINQKLNLSEVGKILKASASTISNELDRHNIKKRSLREALLKYPYLKELKVGDKIVIKKPDVKQPYASLFGTAKSLKMRISIQSLDKDTFQVTRIE